MSEGEPEVCSAAGSSLAAGAACSLVCSVISWSSVDAIAQFRTKVYLWLRLCIDMRPEMNFSHIVGSPSARLQPDWSMWSIGPVHFHFQYYPGQEQLQYIVQSLA